MVRAISLMFTDSADAKRESMKIAIAGMGYVGLSLAMLLAQHNEVRAFDVAPEKVQLLNRGKSPIADAEIGYLKLSASCVNETRDPAN